MGIGKCLPPLPVCGEFMRLHAVAPQNKWLTFSLVAVAVFMSTLDGSVVNLALPAIMKDLGESLTAVGWVLMAYLLTVSALLLTFGRLSDILGRRWVYIRGFIIFTAGSLGCGLAGSAAVLIAVRSFQGIGAAMLMACSQAMIIDAFPASERGKALGILGTVVASGLMTGPAFGGVILEYFSWRMIFFINVPIGIAASSAAVFLLCRERPDILDRSSGFDWAGSVLTAICFSAFLMVLSMMQTWGYASARTVGGGGVFMGSLLLLIRVEQRSAAPLFEPSLLKIRMFVWPTVSSLLLFVSLYAVLFLLPFYLVNPARFSIAHSGYIMTIPFIVLSLMAPFSGVMSDRIGARILCVSGMAVMAAALWALSWLSASASLPAIIWRLALVGVGTGLFISPNTATSMGAVPSNRRGIASSTVATARNVGMVTGVALSTWIFNTVFQLQNGGQAFRVYHPQLEGVFMTSFRSAMFSACVVAVAGLCAALPGRPDKETPGKRLTTPWHSSAV